MREYRRCLHARLCKSLRLGGTMRKGMILAWVSILNVMIALFWISLAAQTPLPPPGQPLVLTAADIQHMLTVNQEDTSLGSVDAGKHVVDVWLDQRKANLEGE